VKGAAIHYSAAERRFLEAHHTMRRKALRAAFVQKFGRPEITLDNIEAVCTRNGWATRRRWSADEEALLRELYPDTPTAQLARRLGRPLVSTYQHAARLGLAKSEAYRASPASGRTNGRQGIGTRFTKGQVPANKGLRRPGWTRGRMKETQFRKGERRGVAVKLYKPIGTERVSKDGYLERKIHDGLPLQSRWRTVQRIRWEALNGPMPKGHALKCLDGNKQNTDPSNWALIPRGLLPRLNGNSGRDYDHAPAALKPTIMAIAKLEHAARSATS
jgi:hypothetical protein